jgi:Rps23 Pro-64 3,4-dihydroxylase Tpa1-like proline 4-hydroxylase
VLSRYNHGDYCFAHDAPEDAERLNAYVSRLNRELKEDGKRRA